MKTKNNKFSKRNERIGIIDLRTLIRDSGLNNCSDNLQRLAVSEQILRNVISDISSLGILECDIAAELDYKIEKYFENLI